MHAITKLRVGWLGVALALGMAGGCHHGGTTVQPSPRVVRIGISPGQEEAENRLKQLKPLQDYFARAMGRPCKIYMASGYNVLIEGLRANKLDVAHMGPFAYMLAADKADAEVLVIRTKPGVGPSHYWSQIITHGNSGITSWDEMVQRAGQLTFLFNDPASTSGHLIPRAFMLSKNIEPKQAFKQVLFGANHTATIMTVKAGKVDVAACNGTSYVKMIAKKMIGENELRVLWKSPPIVNGPVATSKNLPASFKDSLRTAYCSMKTKDPAAWKVLSTEWLDSSYVYEPGTTQSDTLYDSLRAIAKHIDLITFNEN
jgi:phosphonate transport system substrate-binding protein